MTTTRKVVLTVLILGLVGLIAGLGTLSAFSSSTSNPANSFDAGTVSLSDDDAGSAMYSVSNRKPGDTVTRCISVTYGGSLDADVRLSTSSSVGPVGQYVGLSVDKGTATGATFPVCGTFPSQATIHTGTLADFANGGAGGRSPAGRIPSPGRPATSTAHPFIPILAVERGPTPRGPRSAPAGELRGGRAGCGELPDPRAGYRRRSIRMMRPTSRYEGSARRGSISGPTLRSTTCRRPTAA